jgi:hypothetical protein
MDWYAQSSSLFEIFYRKFLILKEELREKEVIAETFQKQAKNRKVTVYLVPVYFLICWLWAKSREIFASQTGGCSI